MPQTVDMINLGFLTDSEREMILEVLRRDEELRQAEEQRVRKLKTELLDIKRKGAKRGSGRYSQRTCGRCLQALSRVSVFSSQCKMCNHDVCRGCRTVYPDGFWLCSVCAKESEIKKSTGDWFYNQRVNRFSAMPAHELVRSSLKKRPVLNKRETVGELLLKSGELKPADAPVPSVVPTATPAPAPRLRQKAQTPNKDQSSEKTGSITSKESLESKGDASPKPARSDTESVENASLGSRVDSDSGHASPQPARKARQSAQSSPVGSSVSSLTVPVKAAAASAPGGGGGGSEGDAPKAPQARQASPGPELDVDRLFKKSVRRAPKPPEFVSTTDLREGGDGVDASMGKRSRSVPGLDVQEDEEEEEEDIDSLVSFHRRTMASSSSSLHSKSTLGSMMSIYSEAGDYDSVEVSGEIVFTISHDEQTQSLQVFVKECRGLACGDASRKHSNPYVKCYLLPDKSRQSKRKTSTKRNTVDPVYNETLKYSISRSQLFTRSMLISVWHHGRLTRNAFLGEVEVALDSYDLDSPHEERLPLVAKGPSAMTASPFAQYKGDLVISLKYVTAKTSKPEKTKGKKAAAQEGGELHVLIKEAKNLMAMKAGGTSDSFVKGYLFPSKAKSTKRKTPVVRKNLNPHYDSTFMYKDLALEQLKDMCLELTVWDREAMVSNDFLGGVRLSLGKGTVKMGKEEVEMDSVGEEISLWEKMMKYPDSWAEGTLPLRSTMGKKAK